MKKLLQWISVENLCIWCYAIFGLKTALLAFAIPEYSKIYWLFVNAIGVACVPLGMAMLFQQKKVTKKNICLFCIPLFYFLFRVFYTDGGFKGDGTIPFLIMGCFMLFHDKLKLKIFNLFFLLFLTQCAFSLAMWCAYLLHIPLGFSELNYYSENQMGVRYVKWGILAIFKGGTSLRLCGIFNEPGALGTLCAMLFITTFSNTKIWQKILLLLTGVCTYSLAYYMLIFLFVTCYAIRKNFLNIIWVLLLPLVFIQIPNIDFGNEQLNRFSQRFAISAEKGLEGNNRSSELYDYEFSKLVQSNDIFFGYGMDYDLVAYDNHGTSSYKRYIVQMGIIGFGLFLALFIAGGYLQAQKNKNALILLFLFVVSIYQRPHALINLYGYIVLFGGMLFIQAKSIQSSLFREKRNEKNRDFNLS